MHKGGGFIRKRQKYTKEQFSRLLGIIYIVIKNRETFSRAKKFYI
jgi:hypothetical protein